MVALFLMKEVYWPRGNGKKEEKKNLTEAPISKERSKGIIQN